MSDVKQREIINRIKAGLILWYPFRGDEKVLVISDEDMGMKSFLQSRVEAIDTIRVKDMPATGGYDHVISFYLPEKEKEAWRYIKNCGNCLTDSGTVIFSMNNRLGIRYFCGDSDPYTGRTFEGIMNYVHSNFEEAERYRGRMYSRREMERLLDKAGMPDRRFYSVYPGVEYPFHIVSDSYLPNEDLAARITPMYFTPDTVFLEEERMYGTLTDNGLFHIMANAYLVECGKEGAHLSDVLYVTGSLERSKENSMITIIENESTAVKMAVYPEGEKRLLQIQENHDNLRKRGVSAVEMKVDGGKAVMPYLDHPTGQKHLQDLLNKDIDEFYRAFDRFIGEVDKSAEIVGNDDTYGPIAKKAYIDMVPLNSLYVDGEYVFIDQEFAFENYPINIVKARAMLTFFSKHDELRFIEEDLYRRYGLLKGKFLYREKEHEFLRELWNDEILGDYFRKSKRKG